ncbi:MAG: DUF971 domain-containing protein [Rhizobiaceae bacterium]|nr:DUF971 domain-containing protein [Rhizobiaceae bacterium]
MSTTPSVPIELRVAKDKKSLRVVFSEALSYEFPAEMLRVLSPSAEVQGHSPAQRQTIGGKKNVEIMSVEAIGNYAIRITFDDMHNTGIFSWAYFLELGKEKESRWNEHLAELEAKGLSR